MNDMKQAYASLAALILAFVFSYFVGVPGTETMIITAVSSIAGFFGIKNFREKFGQYKDSFKSKSVWGAGLVTFAIVGLAAINIFHLALPDLIVEILKYVSGLGGSAGLIVGLIDAAYKSNPPDKIG